MSASLLPWVRMLHILFAALWLGAAAFLTLYLLPALRQLGPAGSATMHSLHQRGLHRFMGANGGLAVLSGLWLYWSLTAGFNPQVIGSPIGLVYGIGGLAGLSAAVIGGAVIGRSVKRIDALNQDAAAAGSADALRALQQRVAMASRIALGLLVLALVAMTMGHAM